MSTLVKLILLGMALCLFVAPAPLGAWHADARQHNASSRKAFAMPQSTPPGKTARWAGCNLTGACPGKSQRPRTMICRQNAPCIPASPAWSPEGPLATKSKKPGGFSVISSPPPIPIPVPAPGALLAVALFGSGTLFHRRTRRKMI
ncbi:MAG: hypothetical protein KJO30_06375 [Boseongicola sp.]|nr:hypothetical protein [Boseongicola sp.]NNJ66818.1 hypothetical protein [Boseongicola sp.]